VAVAPGVVALAEPVDLDPLVAHQDLALHRARLLVARQSGRHLSGRRLDPLEVQAEADAVTTLASVGLGRVAEGHGEGLEVDAPVLVGCVADGVGPQPSGADPGPV